MSTPLPTSYVVWIDEEYHDRVHVIKGDGQLEVVDRLEMGTHSLGTQLVLARWKVQERYERGLIT